MAGINTNTPLSGQDDKLSEYMLTKDQLKCILTVFTNVSLLLLPMYASFKLRRDNEKRTADRRLSRLTYDKLIIKW